MLRIWRCDCALCVIGNEFPCRHTIPPPPSYEGYPLCPKDKNCITLILVDFMHHNVGTCLWHVSNALIHCRLHRNMPKACPYAMALSFFWGWLVVEVEGGVFVAG